MSGMRTAAVPVSEEAVSERLDHPSETSSRNQAGLALDEVEDLYSQHHRCMVSLYPSQPPTL